MSELRVRLQATLHGSYPLDRELGGGGMSRVLVAEELRLGRRVVVKVRSPELAAGISAERFERYIAMPALDPLLRDQAYLAGIRKRLGELYEARGEWPRAAEHYAAFVELWKGADPELQPVVAEVRRRLARGSDVPRP